MRGWLPLILLGLSLVACERLDRVDRPVPRFTATTLSGEEVGQADLSGKPWVINLWVPG